MLNAKQVRAAYSLTAMRKWLLALGGLVVCGLVIGIALRPQPQWSDLELRKIQSLWIGSLPPLPPDPSNRVADDPRAVALGRQLFFDSRFSANGYVSCATCHRPDQNFQDGLPLGKGVGLASRRTQTLLGVAYGPWFFWDGRKDSLWAQALIPLEGPAEHGGHRYQYARLIADFYATDYQALFGALPNLEWTTNWDGLNVADQKAVTLVFVNLGKALEAYERTFLPTPTLFDHYAAAVLNGDTTTAQASFTPDQIAGLKLFISKGNCTQCHATPLFTDREFHNTGVPAAAGQEPDRGWIDGLPLMLDDEFGCKGQWSDAGPAGGCVDRRYLIVGMVNQVGAFKTPSLRNVAGRAPYMHAGQLATLEAVLQHYSLAPVAPLGKSELKPRNFTDEEIKQLLVFLTTLGN
jgi:cytochrome c peroxidase